MITNIKIAICLSKVNTNQWVEIIYEKNTKNAPIYKPAETCKLGFMNLIVADCKVREFKTMEDQQTVFFVETIEVGTDEELDKMQKEIYNLVSKYDFYLERSIYHGD